jgi:hydrogenase maturation protein HypF
MELEAISARSESGAYPLDIKGCVLDARGTVAAVALQIAAGVDPSIVSARFHRAVARATARACADAAAERGLDTVVLAGGVWQNRLLLELTMPLLEQAGLRVLVSERLPPNDGAISFGQAAVAAAQS